MKITERQLRQIIIEELILIEQQEDEKDEPPKDDPTLDEITRIVKALGSIFKRSNKEAVILALKHAATPSPADDTAKDDQELGRLFKDIIYSENPDSVIPLFRQLKNMAAADKKAAQLKKQEEEGT